MKKSILLLLSICMILSAAGCKKVVVEDSNLSDEYVTTYTSEIVVVEGEDGTTTSGGTASGGTTTKPHKPSNNLKTEGAGTDKNANYNVSGQVKVAVSEYRPADYEAMFDAFSQVYPNVEIIYDYRPKSGGDEDECSAYLSTRALSGNMPDIIFDDAGMLPNYLTQGWVYPLDSFVKNDAEFQNVPKNIVEDYTYGGKLYALPHQAHFSGIVLNVDLLENGFPNLKKPSLDWNMTDFENILKAGATDKYAGLEYLGSMDIYFAGCYNKDASLFGYNLKTDKFDMASSYANARKMQQKLRNYPNLEAYQLRFSNVGNQTAYAAKFGSANADTMDMAFKTGKTLIHLEQGTWAIDNLNSICKFDYELYPYPQVTPGCIPIHIDHCFMTSSTKNPEAAFQVLRYMTYSTEGNLARLCMYDENNKGKYALNSRLYYPTTLNPKVVEKFKSLPDVTDIDLYFYQNIPNGYRADPVKIIPGWKDIYSTIAANLEGKDNVDVDSMIPGLESKANEITAGKWADFNKKLASVQASFGK